MTRHLPFPDGLLDHALTIASRSQIKKASAEYIAQETIRSHGDLGTFRKATEDLQKILTMLPRKFWVETEVYAISLITSRDSEVGLRLIEKSLPTLSIRQAAGMLKLLVGIGETSLAKQLLTRFYHGNHRMCDTLRRSNTVIRSAELSDLLFDSRYLRTLDQPSKIDLLTRFVCWSKPALVSRILDTVLGTPDFDELRTIVIAKSVQWRRPKTLRHILFVDQNCLGTTPILPDGLDHWKLRRACGHDEELREALLLICQSGEEMRRLGIGVKEFQNLEASTTAVKEPKKPQKRI